MGTRSAFRVRVARFGAVGALVLILAAGSGQAQPAPPWSPAEKAVAAQALSAAGVLDEAAARTLDDARLAAEVVDYARAETGQRLRPETVDRMWAIAPPRRDVAAELAAARAQGTLAAWLRDLPTPQPAYAALAAAARQYRAIVARGGWETLPAGPALTKGQHGPGVAPLRARLAAEGYVAAAPADPELFDEALDSQLRLFQRRHGLAETGKLVAETRAALNISAQSRLDQIEANLERWRWLPRQLPKDRIEVDVAGQQVQAIENDCETLAMKAVVGDPRHRTPMFISQVVGVTFNPPWNVPASIAAAEILPKAAKHPGYLAANDFIIIDGRLQQKAGPKSALGQVKFELPSPFGVYLHDTPGKSAFNRRARALSHGCMRLEKPTQLAEQLLARQGWTPDRVAAAIAEGKTVTIPLKTPRPLFVVYRTAVVAPMGGVEFRPDVYGWDRKLTEALTAAEGSGGRPAG